MSVATEIRQIADNINSALDDINEQIEAKGGIASSTLRGIAQAVEELPSSGGSSGDFDSERKASTLSAERMDIYETVITVSDTWGETVSATLNIRNKT